VSVTVRDDQKPRISCPRNVTTSTEAGLATAAVAYDVPPSSDNVGVNGVVCSPVSGTRFGLGLHKAAIACSAFDDAGNVASCTFDVVVVDMEVPQLVCSNATAPTLAGESEGELGYKQPEATDNVPGTLSVSCAVAATARAAYNTVTGVTCSTVDAAGNTAECVFYVQIADQEAPVVTCPSDASVQVELGQDGTTLEFGTATAIDNSGETTNVACSAASGSYFEIGIHKVTCEATDSSGNTGGCSFEVDALDPRRPTVVCPAPLKLIAGAVSGRATAVWEEPSATDFFGATVADTVCTPASGAVLSAGAMNATCVATDSVGRQGSCVFSIVVEDVTAPVLMCPAEVRANALGGAAAASVSFDAATAADNADAAVAVGCSASSGSEFRVGRTTVVCTASDAAGNEGACSFVVIVVDVTPPVVTCPEDVAGTTSDGLATAAVTLKVPDASDNVGVVTIGCDTASVLFSIGSQTVICSATDAAGNTGTCRYEVVVTDAEAPAITCPGAVVGTEASVGAGSGAVLYPAATAVENVAVASLGCAPASGSTFSVGTSSVTCEALDAANNLAGCTFTVDVVPFSAPPLECSDNIVVSAGGESGAVVSYTAPADSSCGLASDTEFAIGVSTVVCRSVINDGRACSFTVAVTDTAAPQMTCPGPVSIATEGGLASASVTWDSPSVVENDLRGVTVSCNPPSGSRFMVGNSTVTCTAVDPSGNDDSCSFAIMVSEQEAPHVVCPVNAEAVLAFGLSSGRALWPAASATDNVGVVGSVTCSPMSGNAVSLGRVEVVCLAVDAAGNEGSCEHSLTVVAGDVDCLGTWSTWSACAACPSRRQSRQFEIEIAPTPGGEQCAGDEESRACVDVPACLVLSAEFTLSPADPAVLASNVTLRAAFAVESARAVYDALVGEGVGDLVDASDVSVTSVSTSLTPAGRRRAADGSVTAAYTVNVEEPEEPRVRVAMEALHNNSALLGALQQARYGLAVQRRCPTRTCLRAGKARQARAPRRQGLRLRLCLAC
jgi:hypothetical protein